MALWDTIMGKVAPTDPTGQPMQGLLGSGSRARGLLADPRALQYGLLMMANSGYSQRRRGVAEIVATSALQQQQMQAAEAEQALQRRYREAQIAQLQAPKDAGPLVPVLRDGRIVYGTREQSRGQRRGVRLTRGSPRPGGIRNAALLRAFCVARLRRLARDGLGSGMSAAHPMDRGDQKFVRFLGRAALVAGVPSALIGALVALAAGADITQMVALGFLLGAVTSVIPVSRIARNESLDFSEAYSAATLESASDLFGEHGADAIMATQPHDFARLLHSRTRVRLAGRTFHTIDVSSELKV